jgi:hypothetical protein
MFILLLCPRSVRKTYHPWGVRSGKRLTDSGGSPLGQAGETLPIMPGQARDVATVLRIVATFDGMDRHRFGLQDEAVGGPLTVLPRLQWPGMTQKWALRCLVGRDVRASSPATGDWTDPRPRTAAAVALIGILSFEDGCSMLSVIV